MPGEGLGRAGMHVLSRSFAGRESGELGHSPWKVGDQEMILGWKKLRWYDHRKHSIEGGNLDTGKEGRNTGMSEY